MGLNIINQYISIYVSLLNNIDSAVYFNLDVSLFHGVVIPNNQTFYS